MASYIPDEVNGLPVRIVRYADDTQVAISGPPPRLVDIQSGMECVLDVLSGYFLQSGMRVNPSKTELLLVGSKHHLQSVQGSPNVQFMGSELEPVKRVKNLGVVMDCHLSYESHISSVVNKCNGILIVLMHVRNVLPRDILPVVVNSLVLSHVRYCCAVYGNCASDTALHRLQKMINFAARVVSGRRKFEHISDVVDELGWLSAKQQVAYSTLMLTHGILTTDEPESVRARFRFNRDTVMRNTRQSDHLRLTKAENKEIFSSLCLSRDTLC